MARIIDRDPAALQRFAEQILEYSDNMNRVCLSLRGSMDSARPFMRDQTSQRAFDKITEFAENLINSLPEAKRAGEKLTASAGFLNQALQIQI